MAARKRWSPITPIAISTEDCTPDIKERIIADLPFLRDLTPAEVREIQPLFREAGYKPGEQVFGGQDRTGYVRTDHVRGSTTPGGLHPSRELFVLGAGLIKVIRGDYDGREVVLDFLVTGEFFGSAVGIGAEERAEAHTATCVFYLDDRSVNRLFTRHPSVPARILDDTAERIGDLHRRLHLLSGADVPTRIAATLQRLAEKTGKRTSEGILLQTPLSREELASLSGTTTESASRVVSDLKRRGCIIAGRRWFTLTEKFSDLIDPDHGLT